jgi:hypothetical protein
MGDRDLGIGGEDICCIDDRSYQRNGELGE